MDGRTDGGRDGWMDGYLCVSVFLDPRLSLHNLQRYRGICIYIYIYILGFRA